MIKLTSSTVRFIPDVTFGDFENRKADKADQIVCELRLATKAEKGRYLGTSFDLSTDETEKKRGYVEYDYNSCAIRNIISVTNVKDDKVDGKELVKLSREFKEPGDVIEECFLKICGVHKDDDTKKKDSEA